ncbi:MAG TPA: hypothetical protein DCP92_23090 [Nitrospiraceae bacterium]|jgi:hypothetical protein|nr:hypothetical protein [Nitrospiraceae bacterium]
MSGKMQDLLFFKGFCVQKKTWESRACDFCLKSEIYENGDSSKLNLSSQNKASSPPTLDSEKSQVIA